MADQYCLKCECGREYPVETRHAGTSITCQCGQQLQVPKLAVMRQLPLHQAEQVVDEGAGNGWGVRGVLTILGGLIFLVALSITVTLVINRPRHPQAHVTSKVIEDFFQDIPPAILYQRWEAINRAGPAGMQLSAADLKAYEIVCQRQYIWIGIASAVTLAGLTLLLIPFFIRPKPPEAEEEV